MEQTYTPLAPNATPTLGTSGDAVKTLQTQYNTNNPTATPLKVDGMYGPLTNAALNPTAGTNNNALVPNVGPSTQVPILTNKQSVAELGNYTASLAAANAGLTAKNNANAKTTATVTPPAPVVPPVADTSNPVTGTVKNGDGSTVDTLKDGTQILKYSDGESHTIAPHGDLSSTKANADLARRETIQTNNVQKIVDDAQSLYNSDIAGTNPAAIAKAQAITQQYQVLIDAMTAKNNILRGSYAKNSARTGMLQYANEMDINFKLDEVDKATQRITDLTTKRDNAIFLSNEAYKSGDLKALNAAQADYNTSFKDTQSAVKQLSDLLTGYAKQYDAENKAAATAQRQQKIDSQNDAKFYAPVIAQEVAGLPQNKVTTIINAIAKNRNIDPGDLATAVSAESTKVDSNALTEQGKKLSIESTTLDIQKKINDMTTGKPVTTSELNYIKKNNPLIDADTTNTTGQVNQFIKASKDFQKIADTDYNYKDSNNKNPYVSNGKFTAEYGNKLINNLPEGVSVTDFIAQNIDKFSSNLKNYGLNQDQINTINGN